jgi:ATP-binding cassette, subfamily B, bacterial
MRMNCRIADFIANAWWPLDYLGEALEALATVHGLRTAHHSADTRVGDAWPSVPRENIAGWLGWAGEQLGLEAVPVSSLISDLPELIAHGGPAVVEIDHEGVPGFVALAGRRGKHPSFLSQHGNRVTCRSVDFTELLCRNRNVAVRPEIDRIIEAAKIKPYRRSAVADAMVHQRIAGEDINGITMLRIPAAAQFGQQMRVAGIFSRLAVIVGLFFLLYGAEVWGWQLIGGGTISGQLQLGWLVAWLLLLLTMIPLSLLSGWNEAVFALDIGRLVKSRLLAGALALPPDMVKRGGIGQLIGQVMESEALQSLTMGGAFSVVVAVIELGFAAWIMHLGAASAAHLTLLGLFVLLTLWLGLAYNRRITGWTVQRLTMTGYLIEAMVGHRTRLAQERAGRRDAVEDGQLSTYVDLSAAMDSGGLRLGAGIGMAWMAITLIAFIPALAATRAPSPAALAISLGGILLAQRAFGSIASGLASLSRAGFAWQRVAGIFRAAKGYQRAGMLGAADAVSGKADAVQSGPILEARNLRYTYDGNGPAVIDSANLVINRGDRILVEGPSGGGKSTLAALLSGLRRPDTGLLLLGGLDRPTLGDDWHRHVTTAPQFHENHVFSGTLAFNLLMGRQWPPSDAVLLEAQELCEDLGLGELLRRMPGGIHQRVGETGWQLSHGERSRIFLARALLQKAEVTILDESFASLDPETMEQCLQTALNRAETLLVIAHP